MLPRTASDIIRFAVPASHHNDGWSHPINQGSPYKEAFVSSLTPPSFLLSFRRPSFVFSLHSSSFFAWCSAWCFLFPSQLYIGRRALRRTRNKWPASLGFKESSSRRGGSSSTFSFMVYTSSSSHMVGTRRYVHSVSPPPPLKFTKEQYTNARLAGLNTLRWSVWISRGAGLVLAFDGGLILIPMLRNIIRFVRPKLNWLFPADENIWFHRQVAYSMAFWAMVHTTAHYVNFINVERTRAYFV